LSEQYDASNRTHVKLAAKAAKLAETQRGDAIKGIMSNRYGRAWIWEILTRCHVFAPTFADNPYRTAFSEGERNIGLQFVADIMSHCPERYVEMAREANERDRADDSRRRAAPNGNTDASLYTGNDGDDEGRTDAAE
jgi:hypothetical protein